MMLESSMLFSGTRMNLLKDDMEKRGNPRASIRVSGLTTLPVVSPSSEGTLECSLDMPRYKAVHILWPRANELDGECGKNHPTLQATRATGHPGRVDKTSDEEDARRGWITFIFSQTRRLVIAPPFSNTMRNDPASPRQPR